MQDVDVVDVDIYTLQAKRKKNNPEKGFLFRLLIPAMWNFFFFLISDILQGQYQITACEFYNVL